MCSIYCLNLGFYSKARKHVDTLGTKTPPSLAGFDEVSVFKSVILIFPRPGRGGFAVYSPKFGFPHAAKFVFALHLRSAFLTAPGIRRKRHSYSNEITELFFESSCNPAIPLMSKNYGLYYKRFLSDALLSNIRALFV